MTPKGGMVYRGSREGTRAPLYAQPGEHRRFDAQRYDAQRYSQRYDAQRRGAHHPRHRHRQRGFTYFYGGWWYAYPWWEDNYYYGESCEDTHRFCIAQWGYRTSNYYACMRYYGCY